MMKWLALVLVLMVVVPLIGWYREETAQRALRAARAKELALKQEQNQKLKEIVFRKQGERGLSGAAYGDIMCADGVYLPALWEAGYAISMDGRWIRVSGYGQASPYLVDRKTRNSWTLSVEEASTLDDMQWRLPRWSGEEAHPGMHEDHQGPMSDANFQAWLSRHVANAATPLSEVRDLWVPWDAVPAQKEEAPPELPACPTADVMLGVQRYWPASLRTEKQPLQILTHPQWQLMFNGDPQPWVVDVRMPFLWRPDGQALAIYAYPVAQGGREQRLALAVWAADRGWQKWGEHQPADRKPWSLIPASDHSGQQGLRWMKDRLMQRVRIDTPLLQRLHQGTRIEYGAEPILVPAAHIPDGRLLLRPVPESFLLWERQLPNPERWLARSAPVAGKSLIWTLELTSMDVPSGRPAYRVQWGESNLPGLWELEHAIVRRTWAILLRHPQDLGQDEGAQIYVWDGTDIKPIAVPWPVERLCLVPGVRDGQAARVRAVVLQACVKTDDVDMQKPVWRWHQETYNAEQADKTGWAPLYGVRDLVADGLGIWRLLPNWRSVGNIQHPCSDGDYVWNKNIKDELWWWGGMRQYTPELPQDDHLVPRTEGISVTRSGVVLCGTGPSALPHADGDGWLVLQCPERPAMGAISTWSLHWLQPNKRQIRTLMLQAVMPILEGWDEQGAYWREDTPPGLGQQASEGAEPEATQRPPLQTIEPQLWQRAEVHDLKQGPYGLWLRKQDMHYADAVRKNPDWPWAAL